MNRNMVVLIILAVLVLLTAVQAVQLNSLKTQISEGKISAGNAPSAASGGAAPSSLNDLPSMVGGC